METHFACSVSARRAIASGLLIAGIYGLAPTSVAAGDWLFHRKEHYVPVTVAPAPSPPIVVVLPATTAAPAATPAPSSDQRGVTAAAQQPSTKAADQSTTLPATNRIVIRIREVPAVQATTTVRVLQTQTVDYVPVPAKHHHWWKGY